MQRDKRKIESALLAKGFRNDETHHHYFIYWTTDGRQTTIKTRTSHTPKMKSIGEPLLGQMAKQCELKKSDFIDLVDCPLSQEQYEAILRQRKLL
jgi:hypothetical protein